jgi:acyl-homoserine-lactone acylase
MDFSKTCRVLFLCGPALLLGANSAADPSSAGKTPAGEILWDNFGVPHIYAKTEAGVFYGFGWAQAKSHGNLLLRLYGEARGRGAEYWGPEAAASDRWLVANAVPERSLTWYRAQTPKFRADLDAFARGINDYAAANPEALDPKVRAVLPITGVDIVAHAHKLMNYNYIASEKRALVDSATDTAGGSNAWAVAPSRSASGKTMLLANPHLPWAPSQLSYYEAHLNGPGIEIYGATQVGLPVLRFAFNRDLGFTNTVNTIMGFTTYKLTLDGDGYRFDGKVLPFKSVTTSFKIRQPDGSMTTETVLVKSTVHGPVFKAADGSTVSVRVAGLDRPGALKQYWDMGLARDFAGFQKALRQHQVPMFNIVYGDRAGHILYLHNGIQPERKQGDLAYWSKLVPGDTSQTLWTKMLPYEAMPKVIDPASGFVQNANDAPWVSSWPAPLKPADYAPYWAEIGPMNLRAQMSVHLLKDSGKLSFDDFVARKLTTHSLMADRTLPDLIPLAEKSGDTELVFAASVLKAWDRRFEADSKGALLFETWAQIFAPSSRSAFQNFAVPWSLDNPIETPSGLRDPQQALAMLKQAVAKTKQLYGAVDRPYGEVSRFHIDGVNLPGNGGLGAAGVFRTINWGPLKNGERTPAHGETWVSMVEFGTPMKAVGMMSYGNSSQPGSPHRSDQLKFLATKTFRTLWIDRSDVERNLEEITRF